MKKTILSAIALVALTLSSVHADIINVAPADITFASASTTLTDAGTVVRGNADQVEARSRQASQILTDNRTVATFANFSIGAALGGTINSATLTATYDSQLNNLNASDPAAVGAVATAWDTSGSNNPLYGYGYDHAVTTTNAIDPQILQDDIDSTPATGQTVSADLTSIVQQWADGTLDNNGLVFFINGTGSQGAGFNNVNLEIDFTAVPEPTSLLVIGLGMVPVMLRRRRK